jgi:hypothetical protein
MYPASRCTHNSKTHHQGHEYAADRSKEDEKRVDNFRNKQTRLRPDMQSKSRRSLTVASSDNLLEEMRRQKEVENMEI